MSEHELDRTRSQHVPNKTMDSLGSHTHTEAEEELGRGQRSYPSSVQICSNLQRARERESE